MLLAKGNCVFAHCTFPTCTIHPDAANASSRAIGNYCICDFGRGHEQRAINRRLDILHSGKAGPTHDFRGLWVYRYNVVAAALQFTKK